MSAVISLTGASGSGKSEIIRLFKQIGKEPKYNNLFVPVMIPKYTTRGFRKRELECVYNGHPEEIDVRPVYGIDNIVQDNNGNKLDNEIQTLERMRLFSELGCDIVYEQYGIRYGLYMSELFECLKEGKSPIVILNDVRAVEDVKTFLGDKCMSVFVFRKTPQMEDFVEMNKERNAVEYDPVVRYNKATAINRIYIENIHVFDKLILNVNNGFSSVEHIVRKIVDSIIKTTVHFS